MDLENGNTGFITIHRTLQEKSWYSDPEYLSLWIHLLISANHKNKFYQGVEVKRGQVKTGRIQLAEMTGINQSKIERILKHFEESEQQIEQQKTNKFRIITIKNYDKFQSVNNKVNNSQQQPTTENTTNNDNHVKNEKKKTFTPPTVEEVKKYCLERNNGIDPEQFIAHYETNGWKRNKTPIVNWKACVITWEKKRETESAIKTDCIFNCNGSPKKLILETYKGGKDTARCSHFKNQEELNEWLDSVDCKRVVSAN